MHRSVVVEITGKSFSDATFEFRWNPTSDNWMKVERAMKAHQVANLAHEETISVILAQIPENEIVSALFKHFDEVAELTKKMCEDGRIKLIKAA